MSKDFAEYKRKSWICVFVVLSAWAAVSFLLGIALVNRLNEVSFWGFPLGFWVANQGSEIMFVVLVFLYGACMSGLNRRHDIKE